MQDFYRCNIIMEDSMEDEEYKSYEQVLVFDEDEENSVIQDTLSNWARDGYMVGKIVCSGGKALYYLYLHD